MLTRLLILCGLLITTQASPSGRLVPTEPQAPPVREHDNSSGVSISPFELAKQINATRKLPYGSESALQLTPQWKALGIDSQFFERCSGDCKAETFVTELNGRRGREVVFKLIKMNVLCRFVVFTQEPDGWRVIGHFDHDFNKYEMAAHRVVNFDRKPWLVLRTQAGSGSGFALYGETWFQVGDRQMRPVLSYPVEGQTYPGPDGLGREFHAMLDRKTVSTTYLVIAYNVKYSKVDDVSRRFATFVSNQHRVCYRWDPAETVFVYEPLCSNISLQDIDGIANIQSDDEPPAGTTVAGTTFYSNSELKAFVGGGYEVFLKHNFDILMKIAIDKQHKDRDWLRQFLNDCADITEKKKLLDALSAR